MAIMSWEKTVQLKQHAREQALNKALELEVVQAASALDIGDYDTTTLLTRIAKGELTAEHVTAIAIRK